MNNQELAVIIKSSADEAYNAIRKLKSAIGGLSKDLSAASKGANTFSSMLKGLSTLGDNAYKVIRKVFDALSSSVKSASDRAEELNLFNVVFKNIEKNGEKTFSRLGREATRFQNQLNEAFGTNKTETLRYQGLYQSMGENTGIKDEYAYIMSENLTKLTYDIASLYNASEQSVAEAIRSGVYAGQTKPLRRFGVDVTQNSLKPLLAELGIDDRTISQMSQAEKQMLRYITTLRQASVSMGDFADTIESPANQLKVFRNQIVELRTAIGNLFIGMFADILPYVNAFLMVLKEIAKAIANIFGLSASDYNTGLSALEDTEDYLDGVGSSAGGASKEVAKLNRQVLKFDQINNLKSPTTSGTGGGVGGGSGLSGGIDKRILAALGEYDNLMSKVKMKATEIRDRWMNILGFKKIINPLTGEVSFKYQGFSKTIEGLAKWFGNLSSKAKLFVSLGVAVAIGKIYTGAKKLLSIFSSTGLLTGAKDFATAIGMAFGGKSSAGLLGNLGASVEMWREQQGIIGENTTALSRFTSGATNFIKGVGIAGASFLVMNTGLEDMAENGLTALNAIETLGGAIGTTFGAAQAGAVFGPWGAGIGAGIGLIASLVSAIKGIAYAHDELQQKLDKATKEVTDRYDQWQTKLQELKDSYSVVDSEMSYYENLYNELTQIVDENGKIKDGYEDRAAFITGELSEAFGVEIKTVNGVIQEYDKLKKELDGVIEKEKNRLKLIALEEKAKEAIKMEGDARKELKQRQDELTEAQEHYNKVKGLGTGVEIDALSKLEQAQDNYDKARKNLNSYTQTIQEWERATGLAATNNQEALTEYFTYEKDLYGKSEEERYEYWENMKNENKAYLSQLEQDRNNYTTEEYNAKKKQYDDLITLAEDKQDRLRLTLLTKQGILNDDMVLKWQKLGEESVDECIAEFSKLPTDMQNELYTKMNSTGKGMSEELQKGLDEVKLTKTVTVDANTNPANNKIKSLVNSNMFQDVLKIAGVNIKALGGVLTTRGWGNIPQYAYGGIPSHGTLFAAGENGAEIVGNINRRTEVLNRSQIASAIYSAVSNAISNADFGGDINLYAHTDEGVIIDRINRKTKQTGVCPINIPA